MSSLSSLQSSIHQSNKEDANQRSKPFSFQEIYEQEFGPLGKDEESKNQHQISRKLIELFKVEEDRLHNSIDG